MKNKEAADKWLEKLNHIANQIEAKGMVTLAQQIRDLGDEVHTNGSSWY